MDDIPMADESPTPPNESQHLIPAITQQQRFNIIDVLGGRSDLTNRASALEIHSDSNSSSPDSKHSNMFECDERLALERLRALYPHVDIQKLPRQWSMSDRWVGSDRFQPVLELSTDFLRITKKAPLKGFESTHKDAAAVRANRPVPRSSIVYYFEIAVVSKGAEGRMGLGLSEKGVGTNRLPGWEHLSYGYHGDDGHFFESCGKGVDYGPTFTTGDVVGCGINFVTREIFFTKNGKHLGIAGSNIPITNDLYPTMGMQSLDEMIDVNFGQKSFCYDIQRELEVTKIKVSEYVMNVELPSEKSIWMNSIISNWLSHEGYSKVLESFHKATGISSPNNNNNNKSLTKSDSGATLSLNSQSSKCGGGGSSSSSQSASIAHQKGYSLSLRQSESSAAAIAAAAAAVAADIVAEAMSASRPRRSIVRSVQEATQEEMDDRRSIVRLVQTGRSGEAISKVDILYPTLLESNKQLALLLKIQHFVELVDKTSKDLLSSSSTNTTKSSSIDKKNFGQPHPANNGSSNNTRWTASSGRYGGNESAFSPIRSSADNTVHSHHHHSHSVKRRSDDSSLNDGSNSHYSSSPATNFAAHFSPSSTIQRRATSSSRSPYSGGVCSADGDSFAFVGGGATGTTTSSSPSQSHPHHHHRLPNRNNISNHHQHQSSSSSSSTSSTLMGSSSVPSVVARNGTVPSSTPAYASVNSSYQQNGTASQIFSVPDEMMELCGGGDSLPFPISPPSATTNGNSSIMASGSATNGSSSGVIIATDGLLIGTPPTSTTIIEEDDFNDCTMDGMDLGIISNEHMENDTEGFSSSDERSQFERYRALIEFGQSISQFAQQNCSGQMCLSLRQRMTDAFSLICFRTPWDTDHSYLFSQQQRNIVAKALNSAILDTIGKENTSPLDRYIRQARVIREQAMAVSASSLLTKIPSEEEYSPPIADCNTAVGGTTSAVTTACKQPHNQQQKLSGHEIFLAALAPTTMMAGMGQLQQQNNPSVPSTSSSSSAGNAPDSSANSSSSAYQPFAGAGRLVPFTDRKPSV